LQKFLNLKKLQILKRSQFCFRLPQIFIILLSIKHLTSIHINCTINKTQLDYLTDGFECEISNNLQIVHRNIQIESISGEFNEVQEDYIEYVYVEFGKFGESNLDSSEMENEEIVDDNLNKNDSDIVDINVEDNSNETVQIQSDFLNFNNFDEDSVLKSVDALKLAHDFENEENYEHLVKNYVDMDILGENDQINLEELNNNLTVTENLNSNKPIKMQRTKKNVQENSQKGASIFADWMNFRKNQIANENFTESSSTLKDMKESLRDIQKFLNQINEDDDEELFSESDQETGENSHNQDIINITDPLVGGYYDNSTDYYAKDIANSAESLIDIVESDNHLPNLTNFTTTYQDSSNLTTKFNNLTTVNDYSTNLNTINSDSNNFTSKLTNLTTKFDNVTSEITDSSNDIDFLANNPSITSNFTTLSTNQSKNNTSLINFDNFINNTSDFDELSHKLNNFTTIPNTSTNLSTIIDINPKNSTNNPKSINIIINISEKSNDTTNQYHKLDLPLRISPNFTINSTSINSLITYNNTIHYIPRGIADFFKSLKLLAILNSSLKEIRQIDLKGFPDLRGLWLPYNEIEVLEWHLFDFNPKLTEIILMENRIKIINSNAFDAVTQLGQLDLLRNVCVDKAAYDVDDTKILIHNVRENCDTVVKNLLEDYENYYVISLAVIALLCSIIILYACLKKFSK